MHALDPSLIEAQDVAMSDTATSDDAALDGPGWRLIWALWICAFHLVVVAVAGGLLWSLSYPGYHSLLLAASGFASVVVACCWLGLALYVASTTGRWRRWFLIGPVIGVLTLVLLGTGVPLKMRWAANRDAFAAVVAGHPIPPPGSEWQDFTVPRWLGSYIIVGASWVPGGAVFREDQGDFFDSAGFAYLPGGPTGELNTGWLVRPSFQHLGGGWYSWTGNSS
ncbi:hypothetical protein AB0K00_08175 [Dactylosporangium sp. NPDC049525]|uniref:hypothetical protein n=1 Tax=Dactylosporangium sp. NPDC049525 TaxID=3154730 RepID=UPI003445DAC6